MSYAKSFRPIPAGTSSLSATDATGNVEVTKPARDLLITNMDTANPAYIEFGSASTLAAAVATGMPLLASSQMVISGEGVTRVAAICDSGKTAVIKVTPGVGI